EERLRQQARRTAERVLDTGRESRLKPMTPAERRIIHLELREAEGITTYSEGAEPRRYVVISPTAGLEFIG
ncbi:MAG TPA: R3H domain-containing nucleic acid-binding protein, partial [Clostridia bacterium]|nr:R3H domain-containing nucleic acid-binding protein [Clostridia bacterium]